MPPPLRHGAATHTGLVRSNNEDSFLSEPSLGLWLVADGIGGQEAGEVASLIVKESIPQSISLGMNLHDAIHQSHNAIKLAAQNDTGSPNMGTTVVALLSQAQRYQISWVGDSRAYLWDEQSLTLSQLSKDHSYVQALFDSGAITAEEMENHAQRNIITQSLGTAEDVDVTVDTVMGTWSEDQKILLCSDGLSDLVKNLEIRNILIKNRETDEQTLVDILVKAALDNGGTDNVSVAIISGPGRKELEAEDSATLMRKRTITGLVFLALALVTYLVANQ
ncbi:MAG: serine/threonine-protein phosphatase [Pseudomonadales bacterium]|nr:serine/threonine-protein phosphatase [Pseudomonadales bacterium]